MILRCTTKLFKRLHVEPVATPRASTTVLGDWYATLLHSRRGQFVLAVSRVTLQPIVVTGRELRSFTVRLAAGIAEVLATYGVPDDAIERLRRSQTWSPSSKPSEPIRGLPGSADSGLPGSPTNPRSLVPS